MDAQCFRNPLGDLELNDVPLSLCNDLGRPNLGVISRSSFFFFFFLNYFLSLLSLGEKDFNPSCKCICHD